MVSTVNATPFTCKECGGYASTFDDRMGEQVCDACGLVIMINPFEETVVYTSSVDKISRIQFAIRTKDRRLGSIITKGEARKNKVMHLHREHVRSQPETESQRRMKSLCNMFLSYYSASPDLRDRVLSYAETLQKERLFVGIDMEKRAASLTYFALKEAQINVGIKSHANTTKVSASDISRGAKKIARFYRKAWVFCVNHPMADADLLLSKLNMSRTFRNNSLKMVEYISRIFEELGIRFNNNALTATMWITGIIMEDPLSQETLCEVWESSPVGLRQTSKKICNIINIDRDSLSLYDVTEIVNGVRHGSV